MTYPREEDKVVDSTMEKQNPIELDKMRDELKPCKQCEALIEREQETLKVKVEKIESEKLRNLIESQEEEIKLLKENNETLQEKIVNVEKMLEQDAATTLIKENNHLKDKIKLLELDNEEKAVTIKTLNEKITSLEIEIRMHQDFSTSNSSREPSSSKTLCSTIYADEQSHLTLGNRDQEMRQDLETKDGKIQTLEVLKSGSTSDDISVANSCLDLNSSKKECDKIESATCNISESCIEINNLHLPGSDPHLLIAEPPAFNPVEAPDLIATEPPAFILVEAPDDPIAAQPPDLIAAEPPAFNPVEASDLIAAEPPAFNPVVEARDNPIAAEPPDEDPVFAEPPNEEPIVAEPPNEEPIVAEPPDNNPPLPEGPITIRGYDRSLFVVEPAFAFGREMLLRSLVKNILIHLGRKGCITPALAKTMREDIVLIRNYNGVCVALLNLFLTLSLPSHPVVAPGRILRLADEEITTDSLNVKNKKLEQENELLKHKLQVLEEKSKKTEMDLKLALINLMREISEANDRSKKRYRPSSRNKGPSKNQGNSRKRPASLSKDSSAPVSKKPHRNTITSIRARQSSKDQVNSRSRYNLRKGSRPSS